MRRTYKSLQLNAKYFIAMMLMCCCISFSFGKGGEVVGLSDAFAISEAQLFELLEVYYPEELDVNTVFTQEVIIYNKDSAVVFEGLIDLYSDDHRDLMSGSDFLFVSGDDYIYMETQ